MKKMEMNKSIGKSYLEADESSKMVQNRLPSLERQFCVIYKHDSVPSPTYQYDMVKSVEARE